MGVKRAARRARGEAEVLRPHDDDGLVGQRLQAAERHPPHMPQGTARVARVAARRQKVARTQEPRDRGVAGRRSTSSGRPL